MKIDTRELHILEAQIKNDIKDILWELDGDENGIVYWEGIMKALDRLHAKQQRFNKLVSDMIEQAEAEGILHNELSEEAELEAEEAERTKEQELERARDPR